jgi:arylsulfatase A-like enzyme
VPEGAVLEFGIGVEAPGHRDPTVAGVRFAVAVDGREVFSRVVNPAGRRRDRRWFDERIVLPASAGEAEILFSTATVPAEGRPAGTAGWSRVRIVRETHRPRTRATPEDPSVLLLLVDTLRADRLGCYGARPSPSPRTDALARDGLVFEQAIAQSPWTLPSVATLFTGHHPSTHGLLADHPEGSFLPEGFATLADCARRAGVTTVAMSANFLVSPGTNLTSGFETFVGLPEDRAVQEEASAADLNAAFLAWLRQNRGTRFFAYVHYLDPHEPYDPPAAHRVPAAPGLPPAVASGHVRDLTRAIKRGKRPPLPPAEVAHLRRLYDGEVAGWDDALDALLDGLTAAGVRDTTVVVVTADHGEEFQEHGRLGHGTQLYDEVLRVPLVLAGPGIAAGREPRPVEGIDLFPTLAALLDAAAPAGLPGQDLLGGWTPRPIVAETRSAFAPDGTMMPLLAVRTATRKLIYAPTLGRTQLFDLAADPGEQADRFDADPESAVLAAALDSWRASLPPPPAPSGVDPDIDQKLRALGYID